MESPPFFEVFYFKPNSPRKCLTWSSRNLNKNSPVMKTGVNHLGLHDFEFRMDVYRYKFTSQRDTARLENEGLFAGVSCTAKAQDLQWLHRPWCQKSSLVILFSDFSRCPGTMVKCSVVVSSKEFCCKEVSPLHRNLVMIRNQFDVGHMFFSKKVAMGKYQLEWVWLKLYVCNCSCLDLDGVALSPCCILPWAFALREPMIGNMSDVAMLLKTNVGFELQV